MKTYKEFIEEALLPSLVKGAARYAMRNKHIRKNIAKVSTKPSKTLKFTKLFHGTTKKASDSISKGGWRGDVNVTRQYTGKGLVNATPDNMTAKSYAFDRAAKRNDLPFVRTFKVPKKVADRNMKTLYSGAGDYSGTGYKSTTLTPQQANKYDVTQKVDSSGIIDPKYSFSKEQQKELRQRVRGVLGREQNHNVLRRELKQGNDASLTNIYRNVRQNPSSPNTLENELRGRYRGKGVGRKETTTEQLAPLEKENQLPYKYSKYGIRTVEPSMDTLKDRVKRYGNIQRLKDIDPRYP